MLKLTEFLIFGKRSLNSDILHHCMRNFMLIQQGQWKPKIPKSNSAQNNTFLSLIITLGWIS